MNIHEYQAKQLFRQYAIAVPAGMAAATPLQARQAALQLGGDSWMVKAQVHAGGRGKAGGVKSAHSLEDVQGIAEALLGTRLATPQTGPEGLPVNRVLVEAPCAVAREFYLSLILDREAERLCFIASQAGGMDIEQVARESPEKIHKIVIHPAAGLSAYQCRQLAFAWGLKGEQQRQLQTVMHGMYRLMLDKDAIQVEINPLVETQAGELLALDAKIGFDANALALHDDIQALRDPEQEDQKENRAQQIGLNYIALQGSIGCMVNGAGLAMATLDLVKLHGCEPANFLDVGGGTTADKVAAAFKLIVSDKNVKAILVNIFGGIVQCDMIASGIIQAVKDVGLQLPVVVRLEGTRAEEGRTLLNAAALNVSAADDLESAVTQAVRLAKGAE
ncbi:MAG: ADP-forming succinate--CoA ligase subunit beta [Gammaproteobacteria bacterium]